MCNDSKSFPGTSLDLGINPTGPVGQQLGETKADQESFKGFPTSVTSPVEFLISNFQPFY